MGLHAGQLSSRADMRWCFDAVTVNSARIMGLADYGLEKGKAANFVLLQARDPIEAIRLRPARLAVVRQGKVIAETPRAVSKIKLNHRPEALDPSDFAPEVR